MSLLEDIFLQDEADEAQQLERVIEGDEFEERQRSDSDENSEKEDEAEEDKRRVDPVSTKTKKVIKNPRFILNPARLTGPRGIQVIPDHFKDFKFKGKGQEKEDLDLVLKKLEHWAYRLYPKFKFEDCLKKIETLGKKRPVMVHLHKIRSDQFVSDETVVQKDSSDDEATPPAPEEDEFDKLLQQQIELARSTPAPKSVKKPSFDSVMKENRPIAMPKATSSPSISDEQRDRMLRSRKLAEERRLAKLKNTSEYSPTANQIEKIVDAPIIEISEIAETKTKKHNRSYIIDSSDEEGDVISMHDSITVDVHINNKYDIQNDKEYIAADESSEPITEGHDNLNAQKSNERPEQDIDRTEVKQKEVSPTSNESIGNTSNIVEMNALNNENNEDMEIGNENNDIVTENIKDVNDKTEEFKDTESREKDNVAKEKVDEDNEETKEIELQSRNNVESIAESVADKHNENEKPDEKCDNRSNLELIDPADEIMDVDFSDDF